MLKVQVGGRIQVLLQGLHAGNFRQSDIGRILGTVSGIIARI